MVFDEKVLTALEVLTDAAENDFELFRICNLVRDLVTPPKVEVIDEKRQRFDGVNYSKGKGGHYSTNQGIHRAVWAYYNGEIPEGYVIHHDNLNKDDSSSGNLVCLTALEHRRIHSALQKGKPLARPPKQTKICVFCGKEFESEANSSYKFCSKSCGQKYRLHSENKQETRKCPVCGREFVTHKASKTQCCSVACTYKLKGLREVRKCAVCGKPFDVKRSRKQECCCHICASKLMWERRRAKDS